MGRSFLLAALLLATGACAARLTASDQGASISAKARYGDLTPEAAADKVLSLPGFENALPSSHYAGYITVDEQRGRRLFYYFVESERDPANDPVVLWLNGGPGCSSFDGFVYEHGPFTFDLAPGGPTGGQAGGAAGRGLRVQLRSNPFAWNKVANMLFLDSPAGVGLSYSEHAGDYAVDDERTAADAATFLRRWFGRFPGFGGNDFYVSGESYAGIYVPNLVAHVLAANEAGQRPHVRIVGYLVGNGCTDERYDGNAHPPFAAGKSLLPAAEFRRLQAECGGDFWNKTHGSPCDQLWRQLAPNLDALNVYDTLQYCFHDGEGPTATHGSPEGGDTRAGRRNRAIRRALGHDADTASSSLSSSSLSSSSLSSSSLSSSSSTSSAAAAAEAGAGGSSLARGGRRGGSGAARLAAAVRAAGLEGVWPLPGGVARQGPVLNWAHVAARLRGQMGEEGREGRKLGLTPPCTDSRAADLWLNDPAVRAAIHAAPASAIGPWTLCSDKISYVRTHGSMLPVHVNNTRGHGLRALVYSGDHDMAVPHTGSEAWTAELGFQVEAAWQPWFVGDDQVAGYVVSYAHGLSYATVKGAGHMVPESNPREALALFQRFIDGEPLA